MGKGIGRGPRKSTFHLQAARNENRPYDEEHNKYLLASFLGKDIDGNDLVDDKFDKTKYSMDNELPSPELLQQVMVTVRKSRCRRRAAMTDVPRMAQLRRVSMSRLCNCSTCVSGGCFIRH